MEKALIILDNLSIGYNGEPLLSGITLRSPGQLYRHSRRQRFRQINPAQDPTWTDSSVAGRIDLRWHAAHIRLRAAIHPVGSALSVYRVRGRADGRLWTRQAGAFRPAGERAFTRECLGAAGAQAFAHSGLPNSRAGRSNACSSPAP